MVVHGPYPIGQPPRVGRAINAALRAGFDVDVVATRRPGESRRENVEGAHVMRLPVVHQRGVGAVAMAAEYGGFTAMAAALLTWRSLRRHYDVVHVHNPPDFLVAAAIVPRLAGSRLVLDIHDLGPDMFAMRFPARTPIAVAADRALRGIERLAARVSHAVVTVHEPYLEELVGRGVARNKLHVVMNTVDEDSLPSAQAPARPGFRIVYHGTITPHYGLELVVDALAALRERV